MTDSPPETSKAPWWWPQMRDVLAVASTAMFAGMLFLPAMVPHAVLDQDLKGGIILQWGLVMGWYFGSSKGSAAKDSTIAAMAKSDDQ